VYVRSFDVGLGEYGSTPTGLFRVRPASKAVNPAWANPRTGEQFDAEDPANPIGERWIGLEAVDEAIKDVVGYGIHGTVDPDSIGRERSMGCIRLRDDDIELLYEMLVEETSLVRIVP
jgi:lipoprotein-anchoring transpeptidase ErfK/SrfK